MVPWPRHVLLVGHSSYGRACLVIILHVAIRWPCTAEGCRPPLNYSVLHGESITDQASPRTPTQRTLTTVCNVQPFLQLSPCSLFRARLMQVCDAVHALDSTFGKCSPCNWMQHVHSQRGTCMESVKAETQGLATLLPTSAPYIAKQINSISS